MIRALSAVGLESETRAGDDDKLLIFVRAREEPLRKTVHRFRYLLHLLPLRADQ